MPVPTWGKIQGWRQLAGLQLALHQSEGGSCLGCGAIPYSECRAVPLAAALHEAVDALIEHQVYTAPPR